MKKLVILAVALLVLCGCERSTELVWLKDGPFSTTQKMLYEDGRPYIVIRNKYNDIVMSEYIISLQKLRKLLGTINRCNECQKLTEKKLVKEHNNGWYCKECAKKRKKELKEKLKSLGE